MLFPGIVGYGGGNMEKNSQQPEHPVGGIEDSYLDKLNSNDPDFLGKYIEAVKAPIELQKEDK